MHSTTIVPVDKDERKTMRKSKQSVERLLEFLQVAGRLETSPGFSHALHLNSDRLLATDLSISGEGRRSNRTRKLVFRHVPPPEICFDRPNDASRTVSLGTYLAVLDEVTTWALIAHGKRPGVSVNLHAEWKYSSCTNGATPPRLEAGEPVHVVATVQKVGKSLSFVKAEVFQHDREILCFGGHVKYMRMGFWSDLLIKRGFPLLKCYSSLKEQQPPTQTYTLKELFGGLHFKSIHRATFRATSAHASHGSALHGGCQSILMELVGEQAAKHLLTSYKVELESLHITYQSPATTSVLICSKVLNHNNYNVRMKVGIFAMDRKFKKKGRIISEGLLQWRSSDGTSPPRYPAGTAAQPQTVDLSATAPGSSFDVGGEPVTQRRRRQGRQQQPRGAGIVLPRHKMKRKKTGLNQSREPPLEPSPSESSLLPNPSSGKTAQSASSNDSFDTIPPGRYVYVRPKGHLPERVEKEDSEGNPASFKSTKSRYSSLLPPSLRFDNDDDAAAIMEASSLASSSRYAYSVNAPSSLAHGADKSWEQQEEPHFDDDTFDSLSLASRFSISTPTHPIHGQEVVLGGATKNNRRRSTSPGLSSRGTFDRPSRNPVAETAAVTGRPTSSPGLPQTRHGIVDYKQLSHDDEPLHDEFTIPYLGYEPINKAKKIPGLKDPPPSHKKLHIVTHSKKTTHDKKDHGDTQTRALRIEDFDVSAIPTAQVTIVPVASEARQRYEVAAAASTSSVGFSY